MPLHLDIHTKKYCRPFWQKEKVHETLISFTNYPIACIYNRWINYGKTYQTHQIQQQGDTGAHILVDLSLVLLSSGVEAWQVPFPGIFPRPGPNDRQAKHKRYPTTQVMHIWQTYMLCTESLTNHCQVVTTWKHLAFLLYRGLLR